MQAKIGFIRAFNGSDYFCDELPEPADVSPDSYPFVLTSFLSFAIVSLIKCVSLFPVNEPCNIFQGSDM